MGETPKYFQKSFLMQNDIKKIARSFMLCWDCLLHASDLPGYRDYVSFSFVSVCMMGRD